MSTGDFMATRNKQTAASGKRSTGVKRAPPQKRKKVVPVELGPNPELLFEEREDEDELLAEEDDDCVEDCTEVDYSGTTDEEQFDDEEEDEEIEAEVIAKKPTQSTKVSFNFNCFVLV